VALDFFREQEAWSRGFLRLAGVDEAGRGPLAGPVVAAAVVFPPGTELEGLNDSKKFSPKKRESLFETIQKLADFGIGIISERVIDQVNIYQATRLAMKEAIERLPKPPDHLLIDGNMTLDLPLSQEAIVQGDAKVASIAAASILAKVTRDRLMLEYHTQYPLYGFDRHKGYPSAKHIEAIHQYGLSPIHRRSFRVRPLEETAASR
jgi:ribonuclease HII